MASIQERLAKAKAAAEAAEAAVSSEAFVAKESARKELEALQERERVARERKRAADVAERLDFWSGILGEGKVMSVSVAEKQHDFIVTAAGGKAYRAWEKGIADALKQKNVSGGREKVDKADVDRAYAVAGILDWNGVIVDERGGEVDSDVGARLNALLREEAAVCTSVANAVMRLDGAASEERKS